jgi:hypothetical protein
MGAEHDSYDPEWGTAVAKWTTISTVLLAAGFAAAVFFFIF